VRSERSVSLGVELPVGHLLDADDGERTVGRSLQNGAGCGGGLLDDHAVASVARYGIASMARQDKAVAPGQVVKRYELGDLIGRGGMGEVYRAWDPRLRRDVAIKFLAPELASDEKVRKRFEREATSAARIAHPNVVTIFDTDQLHDHPFIVMECLSGRTLADELREGAVPVARAYEIAGQVLGGLQAAHELGVVHRDIKPSNLLIADDGSVKIADFGIAKSIDALDHTLTGEVIGSVVYMAPERLEGKPATYQSDLYSLAVALYEAVAGDKPFGGETPVAIAHAVLAHEPDGLLERRPGVDVGLAGTIARAMAKDPAHRYASAAEMAAALAPAVPTTQANDPTVPLRLGAADVADAQPTGTATAPIGELTRRLPAVAGSGSDGAPAAARKARTRLVALAALFVAIALAVVLTMHRSSHGVGQAATPTTTLTTNAPAGTVPPAQHPLPRALEDALNQLDQAVRP